MKRIVLICHGNILRSQVLELFIRHHLAAGGDDHAVPRFELYSGGLADWDAYPDTDSLLAEVSKELAGRGVAAEPRRKVWGKDLEDRIKNADAVLVADLELREELLRKLEGIIEESRLHTFYGYIGEGEKSFADTYDRGAQRQDPVRFAAAFDELERISVKVVAALTPP